MSLEKAKFYYKFLIFVTLRFLLAYSDGETLRLCIPALGCLQGTHMPGYQTEKFEAFLGIPYAIPPKGELRFKNPVPFPAWNDDRVIDATKPKSDCIQKNYLLPTRPISGDEDCLYLNLYRPVKAIDKPLPVLFYIYGGGFFSGSAHPAALGPEYFMDTGEVILITVNYRLGPFGFLSTGDETMPGNFGLKDQNLALKWVQQHVANFGGDPKSVTIFGHSAGGSAVQFHMLYQASKGLFQRAMVLSGSAIAPYVAIQQEPLAQAQELANFVAIPNAQELSTQELGQKLREIDATALLNAGDNFKFWHINPLTTYRPTIEQSNWENALITDDPELRMRNGNFKHIPWVMGIVESKGEGAALTSSIVDSLKLRREMNDNFDKIFTQMLEFPPEIPAEITTVVVNMILDEYFHGVHELNNETATGLMELFGDVAFYYPFFKSLKYYLSYSTEENPLYIMKFNYRGPFSYSLVYTGGSLTDYGVVHFDDLLYLFRSPGIFPYDFEKQSTHAELVKTMVGTYVEFAKNGRLNAAKPCSKNDFDSAVDICEYLSIANTENSFQITKEHDFNLKHMQFWESILDGDK